MSIGYLALTQETRVGIPATEFFFVVLALFRSVVVLQFLLLYSATVFTKSELHRAHTMSSSCNSLNSLWNNE